MNDWGTRLHVTERDFQLLVMYDHHQTSKKYKNLKYRSFWQWTRSSLLLVYKNNKNSDKRYVAAAIIWRGVILDAYELNWMTFKYWWYRCQSLTIDTFIKIYAYWTWPSSSCSWIKRGLIQQYRFRCSSRNFKITDSLARYGGQFRKPWRTITAVYWKRTVQEYCSTALEKRYIKCGLHLPEINIRRSWFVIDGYTLTPGGYSTHAHSSPGKVWSNKNTPTAVPDHQKHNLSNEKLMHVFVALKLSKVFSSGSG